MVVVTTKVTVQTELHQGCPDSWERRRHFRFFPVKGMVEQEQEEKGIKLKWVVDDEQPKICQLEEDPIKNFSFEFDLKRHHGRASNQAMYNTPYQVEHDFFVVSMI